MGLLNKFILCTFTLKKEGEKKGGGKRGKEVGRKKRGENKEWKKIWSIVNISYSCERFMESQRVRDVCFPSKTCLLLGGGLLE